ncbi:MAG: hypothetical protein ACK56I_20780, partial [bacterium]
MQLEHAAGHRCAQQHGVRAGGPLPGRHLSRGRAHQRRACGFTLEASCALCLLCGLPLGARGVAREPVAIGLCLRHEA